MLYMLCYNNSCLRKRGILGDLKDVKTIDYPVKKDTEVAEERFYNLLTEQVEVFSTNSRKKLKYRYKTVFLNGPWGSGKTNFINNIKNKYSYNFFKNSDKDIKEKHKRFVFLDLWAVEDNRSILTIGFSIIHPVLYIVTRFIGILFVALSIAITPILGINYLDILKHHPVVKFLVSIGILCFAVWQFMKYKSDNIYKMGLKKLNIKNRILVVDDFDRIAPEIQVEIYKLFNIIQGKMPILFIGEYSKIMKSSDDNYLSKIIDQRLELPASLNPKIVISEVWRQFEDKFVDEVDAFYSNNQIENFITLDESRTLREISQLCQMLNKEFITHGKLGKVQPYQQFLVIYAHMFYPKLYKQLSQITKGAINRLEYDQIFGKAEKKTESTYLFKFYNVNDHEKAMSTILVSFLGNKTVSSNTFPIPFAQNVSEYLISENVSNLSIEEAENILKDDTKLRKVIIDEDYGIRNDFISFISSQYLKLNNYSSGANKTSLSENDRTPFIERKNTLEKIVIDIINEYDIHNNLTNLVINELTTSIYRQAVYFLDGLNSVSELREEEFVELKNKFNISMELKNINNLTLENLQYGLWKKRLANFDLSSKIYFFRKYVRNNSDFKKYVLDNLRSESKNYLKKNGFKSPQKHEEQIYLLLMNYDISNFKNVEGYLNKANFELFTNFWLSINLIKKINSYDKLDRKFVIYNKKHDGLFEIETNHEQYDEKFMELVKRHIEKL